MSGRQEGTTERDSWLSSLPKGFVIRKVSQYVYEINGRKTNIKFSNNLRPDNTFWFNTTPKRLEEMAVFVWLCGTAEDYYVIPHDKMRQLIEAGNWLSKPWNYPSFILNTNYHMYTPAKIKIHSYYRNLSPLR